VVAGAGLAEGRAADRARRVALARQHVVDAPADVALAQVSPGRPPGEELVVVRLEGAGDVDQALGEEALERGAVVLGVREADRVALAFLLTRRLRGPILSN
jgi:hypothetical protein